MEHQLVVHQRHRKHEFRGNRQEQPLDRERAHEWNYLLLPRSGRGGSSTGPMSAISPGVLIGAPTGANTVSGQVTFTETAKGPLYVGFYDQSTGSIYADVVGSKASPPTSLASYTVHVPSGSNYFFFGIIDQNNSGLIDAPGQISNTNGTNKAPVVINGNLSNENLTLPNANAVATVARRTRSRLTRATPPTITASA